MRLVCACLVVLLAAGCCNCGWCPCGGNSCAAPSPAAPYAVQRPLATAEQASSPSGVNKTDVAASTAERQVQYFDGNQPKTFLR